jgi:hypothetical protein
MYARAVDDAEERLRAFRLESFGDLALAALALALAPVAAETRPELALPLLIGGLVVGARGLRAVWRRWELVERLAGDRDAHVIPEVLDYASQQATLERRRSFAALIRGRLPQPGFRAEPRVVAVAYELEALAAELEDESLELEPTAAVACLRLLSDVPGSPLLNPALPADELRSRVRQIRSGLRPTT